MCIRRLIPGMLLLSLLALPQPFPADAQATVNLTLTGSRVTESLTPAGSAEVLEPGGLATYSIIIENDQPVEQVVDASFQLPPGQLFVTDSLRINGLTPTYKTISETGQLRWVGLSLPPTQQTEAENMAGVHVFLPRDPTLEQVDEHLEWAAHLVGRGGTIKLFLPAIAEGMTHAPEWMVHAIQRCYALGMRPVVRLGFANGDSSSFTRRWDDMTGQMSRRDMAGGYWRIGWTTRGVVEHLLAATVEVAAAAPSAELTVIIGNEPNLEWVERDWFIDYDAVRRADGSFDQHWFTTDPRDPLASANSATGWRRFVRGFPTPDRPDQPMYDSRLDDYIFYLGYDAAVEYGRFLRTTSELLRGLDNPRLRIAAGAIASGGGDLEGRYAYHQRHFIRRMLRTVPDALLYIDLWTTNNYPYTIQPWNNYHANPADFDTYPLGEPFWHTEIGIDSYRGDLDYLDYLKRQGLTKYVPTRAIIGEVGYGIGEGWGTAFNQPPITEDLRALYMSTIFEDYYNGWRDELAGVNLWQLGDPDLERKTYHMFDMVYPDTLTVNGWPTHRHLVYDAIATRHSRPGPGRLVLTFQTRLDPATPSGPVEAQATIDPGVATASYTLLVNTPKLIAPSKPVE